MIAAWVWVWVWVFAVAVAALVGRLVLLALRRETDET